MWSTRSASRGRGKRLYRRIDDRVERMLEAGWVDEVAGLDRGRPGYGPQAVPAIGYREIVLYLKGAKTYSDMVRQIKIATHHYAKRQFTWFSKEKDINWYAYPKDREIVLERVETFLRSQN